MSLIGIFPFVVLTWLGTPLPPGYDVTGVGPSLWRPTDWAVPRMSLTVPESSLAKISAASVQQCRQSLQKWYFHCTECVFASLSLGVVLWELWWSGQGQKALPQFGSVCSEWSFVCKPQTLPVIGCFGDVITNLFLRQAQGADFGGQGRCGTHFPAGAPQAYDFDLLGVDSNSMVEAAGVGWSWTQDDWKKLHLSLLWAESQTLASIFSNWGPTLLLFFVLKKLMTIILPIITIIV